MNKSGKRGPIGLMRLVFFQGAVVLLGLLAVAVAEVDEKWQKFDGESDAKPIESQFPGMMGGPGKKGL